MAAYFLLLVLNAGTTDARVYTIDLSSMEACRRVQDYLATKVIGAGETITACLSK